MGSLVSPEYILEVFCDAMKGDNIPAIMDAAGAEVSFARRLHRELTNRSDFRKGSKGWKYCNDLRMLGFVRKLGFSGKPFEAMLC